MAKNTPAGLRNLVLYSIYVRNHGSNGTFADVENDLERIRSMGVDVIWFMPIHPIGEIDRKGSQGSPYSIKDYRAVNPEYGSKDDFRRLIDKAHQLGLRVMIDVVFNHTAHDSVLVAKHPNWYHQDATGKPITTVPAWSDVIDLRHPNPQLTKYLAKTLADWAKFGVDGFRCDVASLVPVEVWREIRRTVEKVKPQVIWLAESVHAEFIEQRIENDLFAVPDCELYRAFDITYDYDIFPVWQHAVIGKQPVSRYLDMLRFQNCIYPANFIKMRYVENHDQIRIMKLAPSRDQALAWTAFQAFNKGAFLLYGGQESAATHTPSLFELDKVQWGSYELQKFITSLAVLKKDPAQVHGRFAILNNDAPIEAVWYYPPASLYGIFNVNGASGKIPVNLPNGSYTNLLTGTTLRVSAGTMTAPKFAAIVRYNPVTVPSAYRVEMLRDPNHQE
ncbi:MAG: alpha-amylase [Anaerolineae bacterium]|nr:alpha-amylase [Anaerolineae bacterium]